MNSMWSGVDCVVLGTLTPDPASSRILTMDVCPARDDKKRGVKPHKIKKRVFQGSRLGVGGGG